MGGGGGREGLAHFRLTFCATCSTQQSAFSLQFLGFRGAAGQRGCKTLCTPTAGVRPTTHVHGGSYRHRCKPDSSRIGGL